VQKTYDKSWYTAFGLGLNAMAVTAPVCPLKTDIGRPSGKRHYENEIVKHNVARKSLGEGIKKRKTINLLSNMKSYNSNDTVI